MLIKLRYFVLFPILLKCSWCVNPNPNITKSLDEIISEVFKPVEGFEFVPYKPERSTQSPQPTVGTVRPPLNCPNGDCVPKYLCNDNHINQDGRGILDLKFADDSRGPQQGDDQRCYDYWETCCAFGNITRNPVVNRPTLPSECGYRNQNGISFKNVNNQNHTEYGEFPWMVAIIREDPATGVLVFLAGGSIIHPNVVLTAAHYVHQRIGEENRMAVRAGEWDTQTRNELFLHQDVGVKKIIVHEQFNEHNLHNDIALLILESPFELNQVVQPICLPPQNHQFDFSRCVASGWGKNQFGHSGKYSVIMKKVDLYVVPHEMCQNSLRTTRLGRHFVLDSSFICAGGEFGMDTCTGDGGSPLVCPIVHSVDDRYYQAGIVAWGLGCGGSVPGAYTNVPLFRPWIDQQLAAHFFQTKYYEI